MTFSIGYTHKAVDRLAILTRSPSQQRRKRQLKRSMMTFSERYMQIFQGFRKSYTFLFHGVTIFNHRCSTCDLIPFGSASGGQWGGAVVIDTALLGYEVLIQALPRIPSRSVLPPCGLRFVVSHNCGAETSVML